MACRGFATTSIAKKIQPAVDVPDQDKAGEDLVPGADPASNGAGGEGGTSDGAASSGAGDEGKKVAEEEDWEKEEGYLQGLVDKLQDKVDKEIARTLKVRLLCFSRRCQTAEIDLGCSLYRPSTSRNDKLKAFRPWISPRRRAIEPLRWLWKTTQRR